MLARIRKAQEENEGGFTLIELLVVIIIIGILAAIAIPVFLNQRKKAVDASIKSDLRTAATALETYFTDNQAYNAATTSEPEVLAEQHDHGGDDRDRLLPAWFEPEQQRAGHAVLLVRLHRGWPADRCPHRARRRPSVVSVPPAPQPARTPR